MRATAQANANIALVKYWGKRDLPRNLPAAGSLSLTLEGLKTTTTVTFGEGGADALFLGGADAGPLALKKAQVILDLVRERAGLQLPARIDSENAFPTGAGLASSASGMAALALAASAAAGLKLSPSSLSELARRGSGSASRSIFGGFAEWSRGVDEDGSDSVARGIFPQNHWDLRVVVVVVSSAAKATSSRRGMQETARTSPYHDAFVASVDPDLEAARGAIAAKDLKALGQVAERSCLRMHADMMASDPALIYLNHKSWRVIEEVYRLRAEGLPLFFTADAGPNVKVFCEAEHQGTIEERLSSLDLVEGTLRARPGGPAKLI